jgi:hypothetical protein
MSRQYFIANRGNGGIIHLVVSCKILALNFPEQPVLKPRNVRRGHQSHNHLSTQLGLHFIQHPLGHLVNYSDIPKLV